MAKLVDINGLTYFWSKLKAKFISGVKVNGTKITPASDMTVDIPLASTSGAGAMSSSDKEKLDAIGDSTTIVKSISNAPAYTSTAGDMYETTTEYNGTNHRINTRSITYTTADNKTHTFTYLDTVYKVATASTTSGGVIISGKSGLMAHTDKNKLDALPTASELTTSLNAKADKDELALKAPLASPSLTGTPTAPTATSGTNTTQIATTAFVQSTVSSAISGITDVYTYKGSKATYAQLPSSGNTIGDVWNVEEEYTDKTTQKVYPAGTNWAWNGSSWDALGGEIILVTNSEIDTIVAS